MGLEESTMNQIGPKSGKIAKNNQRKTTKQANFRVNKATFFFVYLFQFIVPSGSLYKRQMRVSIKRKQNPKNLKMAKPTKFKRHGQVSQ